MTPSSHEEPVDIIALGFRPWSWTESVGPNVRDLHLTVALAASPRVRRIVYVSRPVPPVERLVRRVPVKLRHSDVVLQGADWTLYHDHRYPAVYPLQMRSHDLFGPVLQGRRWWNTALSTTAFRHAVSAVASHLFLRHPVLVNWVPFAPAVHRQVEHETYVYDMIDNFAKHARVTNAADIALASATYDTVARHADVVTSVSPKALASLGVVQGRTCAISNGVTDSWLTLSPPMPADLAPLRARGPVVGTGGYLFEKFRHDLLVETATRMPDVSFVIIGKILDPRISAAIKPLPNVHYLGMKSVAQAAAYYHHFDAGFMFYDPQRENDGDPLKLYEMLAVGTPVVSLPSMGVTQRDGVVEVIQTATECAARLRDLLAQPRDEVRQAARASVRASDFWSAKATTLLDQIDAARAERACAHDALTPDVRRAS